MAWIALQPSWAGGLQTTRHPLLITPVESPYLKDFLITEEGWISPIRLRQTQATDSGAGTESIRSIAPVRYSTTAAFEMVFVNGTKIRRFDGTTITDITGTATLTLNGSTTRKASIITYNALGIGVNGNDAPWKVATGGTASALGGSPPSASKYATVHKDHVVFLQQDGTIRASNYQSEAVWPNTLSFTPEKFTGAKATGILSRGNVCWVFFEDSVWTWDMPQFGGVYRLIGETEGVGCPYPWTIQPMRGGVCYLGYKGAYFFDGGSPQPMTRGIEDTISQDTARVIPNRGNEENVVGVVLDGTYWILYDDGQGSTVDTAIRFDFDERSAGAWTGPHAAAANCGAVDTLAETDGIRRMYMGEGQAVVRWPHASATMSTAFEAQTRAWRWPDDPMRRVRLNRIMYTVQDMTTAAATGDQKQELLDDITQVSVRMSEQSAWTNLGQGRTADVVSGQDGWQRFYINAGTVDSNVNTEGDFIQVRFTRRGSTTVPEFVLGPVFVDVTDPLGV